LCLPLPPWHKRVGTAGISKLEHPGLPTTVTCLSYGTDVCVRRSLSSRFGSPACGRACTLRATCTLYRQPPHRKGTRMHCDRPLSAVPAPCALARACRGRLTTLPSTSTVRPREPSLARVVTPTFMPMYTVRLQKRTKGFPRVQVVNEGQARARPVYSPTVVHRFLDMSSSCQWSIQASQKIATSRITVRHADDVKPTTQSDAKPLAFPRQRPHTTGLRCRGAEIPRRHICIPAHTLQRAVLHAIEQPVIVCLLSGRGIADVTLARWQKAACGKPLWTALM
jgi:hypothetical protein